MYSVSYIVLYTAYSVSYVGDRNTGYMTATFSMLFTFYATLGSGMCVGAGCVPTCLIHLISNNFLFNNHTHVSASGAIVEPKGQAYMVYLFSGVSLIG